MDNYYLMNLILTKLIEEYPKLTIMLDEDQYWEFINELPYLGFGCRAQNRDVIKIYGKVKNAKVLTEDAIEDIKHNYRAAIHFATVK